MSDPKTPRALLLARHAAAVRRLDALRHEAIAGQASPASGRFSLAALLHALLYPHRHAWGTLAVVWIGLLTFHFTVGQPHPGPSHRPPPEAVAAWLAQQQSLELLAQMGR